MFAMPAVEQQRQQQKLAAAATAAEATTSTTTGPTASSFAHQPIARSGKTLVKALPLSAVQITNKIERKINRDGSTSSISSMPKIQQKHIHKELTQSVSKTIGKNGKVATAAESQKNAATGKNALDGASSGDGEPYEVPMSFSTDNWTIISTQIGANALLPCTVHAIGEGVVSIVHIGRVRHLLFCPEWLMRRNKLRVSVCVCDPLDK